MKEEFLNGGMWFVAPAIETNGLHDKESRNKLFVPASEKQRTIEVEIGSKTYYSNKMHLLEFSAVCSLNSLKYSNVIHLELNEFP